jgi:hypothetical protein
MMLDPESKALWDELKQQGSWEMKNAECGMKNNDQQGPRVQGLEGPSEISLPPAPCCRIMMSMKKNGMDFLNFFQNGLFVSSLEINNCPQCGRKLD